MRPTITVSRPDGQQVRASLTEPALTAGARAVVVMQGGWGVNDQLCGAVERVVAVGYFALIRDLYRGKSTIESEEANHSYFGGLVMPPTP